MRKLMLLALALMLWALPAWAGEPAGYEALVGDWMGGLVIWDDEFLDEYYYMSWESDPLCVITEDGQIYSNYLEIPISPLLYDEAAGQWYVQDDERDRRISLHLDRYGSLVVRCPYWTVVLLRPDATSPELPPTDGFLTHGSTWELTGLLFYGECMSPDMDAPDFMVEAASLGLPALTVRLGASPDKEALYQAVKEAINQQASGTFLQMLSIYYGVDGYELCNSDTLLLRSSGFSLVMTRIEMDEVLRPYVQQLTGRWLPDGVTVGGIPVSPEALFDAEDVTLAIDEAGYARLGDRITALTLADGALLLDGMPLTIEGGGLTLEAAEGVMLHFVTEADWYRAQLGGDWRLDRIAIPGLDMATSSGDDGVSGLLVISADGTVTLQHDGGAIRFTLQSTDSVTEYILLGEDGDVRTLSILSVNSLRISITGGSGAYTCYFVPAE